MCNYRSGLRVHWLRLMLMSGEVSLLLLHLPLGSLPISTWRSLQPSPPDWVHLPTLSLLLLIIYLHSIMIIIMRTPLSLSLSLCYILQLTYIRYIRFTGWVGDGLSGTFTRARDSTSRVSE